MVIAIIIIANNLFHSIFKAKLHLNPSLVCFFGSDMLSPTADPEVPMDFSSEYDGSDKSSIDDSDEACSIPGSFSPDNNQDGASGDQRCEMFWSPDKNIIDRLIEI